MKELLIAATVALGGCAHLQTIIGERPDQRPPGAEPPTGEAPAALRGDLPPPIFGSWWYINPETMKGTRKPKSGDLCAVVEQMDYRTPYMYVPVTQPGAYHGGPSYVNEDGWYTWYARCYAQELDREGAPIAILIRNRNAPFPYETRGKGTSPDEVASALDALPKLDYLLMDLEPHGEEGPEAVKRNVEEIHRLVRSHPNPRISNAYIGNYNDWPGERNPAHIRERRRDRTTFEEGWDRDAFYRAHLNVAMPVAYPSEADSVHADPDWEGGPVSPNDRAATFWAQLAGVSAAARNLPEGHLLIPWVSNYVAQAGREHIFHAPPPTREDLEALMRHYRLRGAYSYFIWTTNPKETAHPTIDHDEFAELSLSAWTSLNPLFEDPGGVAPLNLEAEKSSGVQWSGGITTERAWVLVSNLGDEEASVDLPDLPGLPDRTPPVPPGEHRLFRWPVGG